jgi:multisubunit Na+/H+ antiporter MnhF subunit
MHTPVMYIAMIWTLLLLGITIIMVIRSRALMVRVLALDAFTLILITLLVLLADLQGAAYYLDAALMLALLSFAGTIAAARYYRQGDTLA